MLKWWQKENFYQIYLRSFFDSNDDGIGDILGVVAKLDYLKDLGVSALWISPHYQSPMDDNGYDVSDFYRVANEYGTIEDFKKLIFEAHQRGMKIITDLVLNHTSDEHDWFKAAADPNHIDHQKYHDYYIWHKPKYNEEGKRIAPTRWIGWFGNPTWSYNQATDEYYLHIFSKKMPDLNWRNKNLREDVKKMIEWWLTLGIDGFRVDASNHIEKNWEFPDGYPGYENFTSLPKHHDYLKELGEDIFSKFDIVTIGESGGASKEEALKYVGYGSNEFNMLIQFGHCWSDVDNNHPKLNGKWAKGKLHVSAIKKSFDRWYEILSDKGWNIIYWHNHDQPRVLSHYGDPIHYPLKSAKMLAYSLYFMPGTALLYQGEELGMTNVCFTDIHMFRDVEVFTEYQNMLDKGLTEAEALKVIQDRSRDNARTPFQWSDEANAGFSHHQPWIPVNGNYKAINLEDEMKDENSVFNTYKSILNYRKENTDILEGNIHFIDIDSDDSYAYVNEGKEKTHLVLCNFTNHQIKIDLSNENIKKYELLYSNSTANFSLEPIVELGAYEAYVYVKKSY